MVFNHKYEKSDVTFLIRGPIKFKIIQIATNMAPLKINFLLNSEIILKLMFHYQISLYDLQEQRLFLILEDDSRQIDINGNYLQV